MRNALLLAAAMLLAACATIRRPPLAPPAGAASWPERRAALQALPGFELRGRVAVSTGNDGFNARLRWNQAGTQSDLALDGPLGIGGARVSSDGQSLVVTTPKGERLDRDAAQAELRARLGFEPPLGELRYWVLGVPAPAAGAAQEMLDGSSRLAALDQDGWHVDYSDYRAADPAVTGDGASGGAAGSATPASADVRPTRVTLTRGPLRVRLLIDHWS